MPISARTPATGSRTRSWGRASPRSRSASANSATSQTPVRIRSPQAPHWRAPARRATATCSCSSAAPAGCMSSITPSAPHADGKPGPERCSTCAATPYARRGGRAPTPPGCRSCRCSCAIRRCTGARSAMPCASPSRAPSAATSTRPRTSRLRAATAPYPRWVCACASKPTSASPATTARRSSCCVRSSTTA